jgi:hypothetical protein
MEKKLLLLLTIGAARRHRVRAHTRAAGILSARVRFRHARRRRRERTGDLELTGTAYDNDGCRLLNVRQFRLPPP